MNKVSVIVPVYNAGKKLHKCIRSILNQSYNNFELILVNDGSTDNSYEICKKYAADDKRIKLINQENQGSVKARRNGIENSEGDYIMFVDADDWVDNQIIERLYNESKENDVDITVAKICKVLGDKAIIKEVSQSEYFKGEKVYKGNEIKNILVESYLYGHSFPAVLGCKLYRRELLINAGKYVERIHFLGDDLFLNIEVFLKANRVKLIDEPLYYYRIGGFTSKYMPYHFDDIVNGYEIQKEVIEEFYEESRDYQLKGISIMLLNSFKISIQNLMNSKFNHEQKLKIIKNYILNDSIQEATHNEGSKAYFQDEYLKSINDYDVKYLYDLGKELQKKSRYKNFIKQILTKVNIV